MFLVTCNLRLLIIYMERYCVCMRPVFFTHMFFVVLFSLLSVPLLRTFHEACDFQMLFGTTERATPMMNGWGASASLANEFPHPIPPQRRREEDSEKKVKSFRFAYVSENSIASKPRGSAIKRKLSQSVIVMWIFGRIFFHQP